MLRLWGDMMRAKCDDKWTFSLSICVQVFADGKDCVKRFFCFIRSDRRQSVLNQITYSMIYRPEQEFGVLVCDGRNWQQSGLVQLFQDIGGGLETEVAQPNW